jgi:hypothetical protein
VTRRSKKTGRYIRARKSHRRGGRRTETWRRRGKVRVRRNRKGQFITWRKVRRYTIGKTARRKWKATAKRAEARRVRVSFGGKGVAVYGGKKRIQMHGSGIDLYRAMRYAVKHPPKEQFLDITAEEVIHHPEKVLDFSEGWHGRPTIDSI